ncbi:5-methylcytosine rRNA methyltransferase NSUN4 [Liparis tanakae]|uniref:5-methylcytosine rRNA methyltransferase NSUN4 n=1 Tax=Liparis tanakae TaxID=230148 RepID=A0A4Z2HVV5_9TELE|nr:5-methylcytosine rRNA methyltransferase NSUN4 [Liparis tanakae]
MALLMDTRLLLRKVKDLRCLTPRRHRVKEKWASNRTKYPPTSLALQHFDATHSVQLGPLWPSIRAALLSEKKYGALLNNFSYDVVRADLEAQGCSDFLHDTDTEVSGAQTFLEQESEVVGDEESSGVSISKKSGIDGQQLSPLHLSPHIKCLVFPRGNITRFKPAKPDMCGLLGYYLMDAASLLPCLALDVQEGHNVLDLCAAPGGKTVALLQTQSIGFLCVNDASVSRTMRLRKVLDSYIPKPLLADEKLRITSFDGTLWGEMERNTFDRNQSVVEQAIALAQEKHGIKLQVVDLRPLKHMFRKTFHFAPDLHLGEMVIPHLAANFGPIYMCKLRRLT